MCTCTSNNHPYIHRNLQMLLFHLILELAFITETNFLLRFSTHAFLVWPIQYVFNESIKFSSRPLVIWLLSLKQKTTFVLNYKKKCLWNALNKCCFFWIIHLFFGRNSRQWDKKVHSIHSFLWFAFWYIKHINMYL